MQTIRDASLLKRVVRFEIRFMLVAFGLSLAYELAHSPLYVFVDAASTGRKLYYIVHCSFRDLIPFLLGYHLVALIVRKWFWLIKDYQLRNITLFTFFAFCYTILSELYHVHILKSWAFKEAMPMVPLLKIGLTPFLQSLILTPLVAKALHRLSTRN
jgi:hypothetical protein